MTISLVQFSFSHYNEKVRWALDYKGIAHRRRSLHPGFHIPVAGYLSGQIQTPFIHENREVVTGSATIIDHLETNYAQSALYPEDTALRKEALEIQKWFDDEVGPATRSATFFATLGDPLYLSRVFAAENFWWRCFYLMIYPVAAILVALRAKVTPARAAEGRDVTLRALDFVAANAGENGYLVGDGFTVADLTAAALLSVVVMPPQFLFPGKEPRPASVQKWVDRWADHPGSAWVQLMYQRHRGESMEIIPSAGPEVVPPKTPWGVKHSNNSMTRRC